MRISDWSSDVCSSDLYYSTGRNWCDYAPAYRYGHVARDEHPHERFEQVEPELAREWRRRKADSRLQWTEARGAVRDGWRHHDEVERGGHLPAAFSCRGCWRRPARRASPCASTHGYDETGRTHV